MKKRVATSIKRPPASAPRLAGALTGRQRFLHACHCRPVDRPPVWLMRQAGRALPEYRALKEQHSFLELVQTPELAAEVTLQPIRRFGFDAAILFCDILVVAEGLGQRYQFRDRGGIEMEFLLKSAADIARLDVAAVTERLQYVAQALPLIKSALDGRAALIGFAGSPWTLANFMMEGGGVKEYTRAKALFYAEPALFARLMDKLTRAVSACLQLQIDAGADAVQIFDSLGGVLSDGEFSAASARWIKQIIASLKGRAPVILFSKGTHGNWDELAGTGAQALGVDWNVRLAEVAARLPGRVAVQGNLDPFVLTTTPAVVAAETGRILRQMRGRPGHIFNLGHGVPPSARLENIESLVNAVRSFKGGEFQPPTSAVAVRM
ncbi:MAG TPA: uroporphyrinogen decarboxylase [Candidatus Paceibacterota bacterium]|nr:uroporphyrinogen decarboxylase [Verrucomicrobiota bacterium]HSA09524.1 uroporphyrinogen decarboxylase [Candidatus Paceibacterota bacterium]